MEPNPGLTELFSIFDKQLAGIDINLGKILGSDRMVVLPEEKADYPADSSIYDTIKNFIDKLARAVDANKNEMHLPRERFSNGLDGLQLPDSSLDVVVNLALCRELTGHLPGREYSALRHQIRMHLIGQAYRLLRKGGVYLAIGQFPQVGGYEFKERVVAQQDGYCATFLVK